MRRNAKSRMDEVRKIINDADQDLELSVSPKGSGITGRQISAFLGYEPPSGKFSHSKLTKFVKVVEV